VGQVLDLTARAKARSDRIVVTPSGERQNRISAGEGAEGLLELNEQGIYEVRSAVASGGRPEAIAVNLDPAESDLAALDPERAHCDGHRPRVASPGASRRGPQEMTREESEKRQSLWWYLLLTGLLLLAAETIIANRLSRKEKFL
jgi:hypothetical protein